ncbi:hypothetical protein ABLE93_11460 [Xanthobacter sp. KR7-65]|uniref:AbiTii domain-containing protein n=1 Tax=Xanthobacter sp. KR7-65 TaxID=3156612 RepID=UPI0032B3C9A0
MSLLRDIQKSLLSGSDDLGPVLLRLRFLAAQLGSIALEEWVKHEAEGYPSNVEVPSYRQVSVEYVGDFSGPFGSGIRNAPIPSYLIAKFAGEQWINYRIRQSLSSIEALVGSAKNKGENLHINSSNLILLLQGKVYEDYACNNVSGRLSVAALVDIQNAVRSRVLELTLKIEKEIPDSVEVDVESVKNSNILKGGEKVSNITNQVVYGNYTSINNSGDGASINLNVASGSVSDVVRELSENGLPHGDAAAFAQALAADGQPLDKAAPFGPKSKSWMKDNISKAIDGTWKIGVDVASKILTEVALRYYGLK